MNRRAGWAMTIAACITGAGAAHAGVVIHSQSIPTSQFEIPKDYTERPAFGPPPRH